MAGFHHHHQVRERHGLLLAVSHVDESDAEFPLEALEFAAHVFAQERIERRQRLVEEEDLRPGDQGARQRDALLLTAGHLRRQAQGEINHLDEIEELARSRAPLGLGDPTHLEAVGDVVDRRHMGKERVVLEHHRCPATGRWRVGHIDVPDQDVARAHLLVTGDHPQRRRLAAAARPEQTTVARLRNPQRDRLDSHGSVVALADGDEFDVVSRTLRVGLGKRGGRGVDGGTSVHRRLF
jgi:hypothetical protein